jgi:hypothetical protein
LLFELARNARTFGAHVFGGGSAFIFPTLDGTLARIMCAFWAFVRHIAYMPLFGPAR